MTIGDRIKKLRKALGLTQQEFADDLKISRSNIATYEVGKNNPADAVIALICNKFSVSETWLRTGMEPMFIPKGNDPLDELVKQKNLSDSDRILIEKFISLKSVEREAVIKYITELAERINATKALEAAEETTPVTEKYVQEARAEADAVRDQVFKELLQEKKQVAEFSVSQSATGKKVV